MHPHPNLRASIRSVKLRYFRIFLRTFAIGLAAVWIVGGLKIAWRDKTVDLPTASEDVLYTFPAEGVPISSAGSRECGLLVPNKSDRFSHRSSPLFIISRPKAQYTAAARLEHVEGTVELRVAFLANGNIGRVNVVRGLGFGLDDQAVRAARQITFHPKIVDGTPVSVEKTVEFNFNID